MDINMDMHMMIPASLADLIDDMARKTKRTRTTVVREAIEEYLDRRRRRQLDEELARYVETMSPASAEFTEETSRHTSERLLRETEW